MCRILNWPWHDLDSMHRLIFCQRDKEACWNSNIWEFMCLNSCWHVKNEQTYAFGYGGHCKNPCGNNHWLLICLWRYLDTSRREMSQDNKSMLWWIDWKDSTHPAHDSPHFTLCCNVWRTFHRIAQIIRNLFRTTNGTWRLLFIFIDMDFQLNNWLFKELRPWTKWNDQ